MEFRHPIRYNSFCYFWQLSLGSFGIVFELHGLSFGDQGLLRQKVTEVRPVERRHRWSPTEGQSQILCLKLVPGSCGRRSSRCCRAGMTAAMSKSWRHVSKMESASKTRWRYQCLQPRRSPTRWFDWCFHWALSEPVQSYVPEWWPWTQPCWRACLHFPIHYLVSTSSPIASSYCQQNPLRSWTSRERGSRANLLAQSSKSIGWIAYIWWFVW